MRDKKVKKVGRPKLPKGEAKEMVQFRAQPGERKQFEKAAASQNLTLSEWIRQTLKEASQNEMIKR